MGRKKKNITKLSIVQVGTKAFLELGYSKTTMKYIGEQLGISTGNITFYYPTKEHLLSILVEMLCHFQWDMFKNHAKNGDDQIFSACLELIAMASICEENEKTKELYLSVYTHSMTLDIVRSYDSLKAHEVYKEYCSSWDKNKFDEAEMIVSGIEYAVLCTDSNNISFENKLGKALETIMCIYNVPLNKRKDYIQQAFKVDYRSLGREILLEFIKYIEKANSYAINGIYSDNIISEKGEK